MSFLDVGAAFVAEYGRLIGILTSRDMLARSQGGSTPARLAFANG